MKKEREELFFGVQFELIFGHPCFFMSSVHALSSLVRLFTERCRFQELCHLQKADGLQSGSQMTNYDTGELLCRG